MKNLVVKAISFLQEKYGPLTVKSFYQNGNNGEEPAANKNRIINENIISKVLLRRILVRKSKGNLERSKTGCISIYPRSYWKKLFFTILGISEISLCAFLPACRFPAHHFFQNL
jgi:hypothetical protein